MEYTKIMGIDYGQKRMGIAFSDYLQIIACAYEIYHRKSPTQDIEYLHRLIDLNNVKTIVFGMPLQTDGKEGEIAEEVRTFAAQLVDGKAIAIHFVDERFTSYEAESYLKEAKIPWQDRKKHIDKVAAQIILQNYLDSVSRR